MPQRTHAAVAVPSFPHSPPSPSRPFPFLLLPLPLNFVVVIGIVVEHGQTRGAKGTPNLGLHAVEDHRVVALLFVLCVCVGFVLT
jgi:hypothetical protein